MRDSGCPSSSQGSYPPERTEVRHDYFPLFERIDKELSRRPFTVIGIDGMCGSGKSSLASRLGETFSCNIVHADDFFLPPALRTPERLAEPGGNIHYERFLTEIVTPLQRMRDNCSQSWQIPYRVFQCSTMDYRKDKAMLSFHPLTVIEGAYCMRPDFYELYDCTIFLSVSPDEQKKRLLARNGPDLYRNFEEMWIPMENRYFTALSIPQKADFCFLT